MKVYLKFFTNIFFRSLLYVLCVMISLVFILNYLGELDFFQDINVKVVLRSLANKLSCNYFWYVAVYFFNYISNFFIKLFSNNELITFKYSGLKNTKIISILIALSLITGIFIITVFYYFSSNLKNFYLELKSPYTNDGKYLRL